MHGTGIECVVREIAKEDTLGPVISSSHSPPFGYKRFTLLSEFYRLTPGMILAYSNNYANHLGTHLA